MNRPGTARAAFVFVVLVLFGSAQLQIWSGDHDFEGGPLVEAVLAAAFTLPLLYARLAPLLVLLAVLGAAAAHFVLGGELGQPWFALLLSLFVLGDRASVRASTVGLFTVAAATLAIDLPRLQDGAAVEDVLPGWFVIGGAWSFGRWMRSRHETHEALLRRTRAAEEDRAAALAAAVDHERARIARELHDMVAHSLAVIVLQAQAGQRVLSSDPPGAARTLGTIETLGREGLAELRRLLALLLDAPENELEPRPSLRYLDLLVERTRDAGLPVALDVQGDARPLPAGLDLSAYRIVQEALTNALKHGGDARAEVVVRYLPAELEISVSDDGRGTTRTDQSSPGRGLVGMQERVALYGGTLTAAPRPGGGFTVLAQLPLVGTA